MSDVPRILVEDARRDVKAGAALLVCAYENETLCSRNRLEDSLYLAEFTERVKSLSRDQEIIFYCV